MQQNKILNSIYNVYKLSKDNGLAEAVWKVMNKDLKILTSYFNQDRTKSFIIAMVFNFNYLEFEMDLSDLTSHLSCNHLDLYHLEKDFLELANQGILIKKKSNKKNFFSEHKNSYIINDKIRIALLNGEKMPDCKPTIIEKDQFIILAALIEFQENFKSLKISFSELIHYTERIFEDNQDIPFIKWLSDQQLSEIEYLLLLSLIWRKIELNLPTNLTSFLSDFIPTKSKKLKIKMEIFSNNLKIMQLGYVVLNKTDFIYSSSLELTKKTLELLNDFGLIFKYDFEEKNSLIYPESFPTKKLFFNEDVSNQIKQLEGLLEDTKFKSIQQQLESKGLGKGFNILFHGFPGTGKTELVKQLAKISDRGLFWIDISETKSVWYGESEKNVKKIFSDYYFMVEKYDKTPILFLNEADAILSKRQESNNSRISNTENAIQNILLEELENFNGILIATTNLIVNLDNAYDRRFLFKIKFERPNLDNRKNIWESKFPELNEYEIHELAKKYDFSGAQIENVLRKKEIYEVIQSQSCDFLEINKFCKNECFGNRITEIGFK